MGVAGFEESEESCLAAVADAFMRFGESACSVEGVAFASSIAQGFVLDASSDLIEAMVSEAHHVERVGDLAGVGPGRRQRDSRLTSPTLPS